VGPTRRSSTLSWAARFAEFRECHVGLAVAHDRLDNSGIFLFVHQTGGKRMSEGMKAETLHDFAIRAMRAPAFSADRPGSIRGWAKVVFKQLRSASRLLVPQSLGRKDEILAIGIHRLLAPSRENLAAI
jgi:hypothetical protein